MRHWSLPTKLNNNRPYLRPQQINLPRVRLTAERRTRLRQRADPFQDLLSYYLSAEEYNPFVFLYPFKI
jgi:hypothetical protein